MATAPRPADQLLIRDVRIFDGTSATLEHGDVLIEDRRITAVSSSPLSAHTVIDGGGRVLMPGMLDAHVHLVGNGSTFEQLLAGTQSQIAINALAEAGRMLLRGFTTVRDMAGDTASLRTSIDAGVFPGPRIYASQAAISQTSGHGDFSNAYDACPVFGGRRSRAEDIGFMRVADGPEQVLAAVREQLKRGAAQIKLMVGGGAASLYDPLDTVQFVDEEIQAAVRAAEDYGTYVATHVYNVRGIRRAIAAGVRSIEHGQLADEDTVALMADKEIWLSTQPFAEADHQYPDPGRQAKNREICDGVHQLYGWARKHGVRVAFGTDLLLEPAAAHRQSDMAVRLGEYYSNVDALRMLTSGNADLLALSGTRDPYQQAPLGRIVPGAWADVLLVDGNPLDDLALLADPERNLPLIVKDGHIHKNTLTTQASAGAQRV